jgi:uncharacterized membrane protein
MSFKEWEAAIQIAGAVVVTLWLIADALGPGIGDGTVASVAMRLLWAIGAVIVFNIIVIIVVAILVSIARREEFKDEKADERDRSISTASSRNGYIVTSIAAAAGLVGLAFGVDPVLGAYGLFGAPMLGGVVTAASQLYYYRVG